MPQDDPLYDGMFRSPYVRALHRELGLLDRNRILSNPYSIPLLRRCQRRCEFQQARYAGRFLGTAVV